VVRSLIGAEFRGFVEVFCGVVAAAGRGAFGGGFGVGVCQVLGGRVDGVDQSRVAP
jgi:hypothetical protein